MAVNYVLVGRRNPGKPEAPKKFYAQAKSSGALIFRKLSREIAEGSTTVNDTDVLAVLNELTKVLKRLRITAKLSVSVISGLFRLPLQATVRKRYIPACVVENKYYLCRKIGNTFIYK
jgi:hypothetical protein